MSSILDKEWSAFLSNTQKKQPAPLLAPPVPPPPPVCDELYISTKTKVLYLNQPIDIHALFWRFPVIEYGDAREGIIKKQIKVVSKTVEEFEMYRRRLDGVPFYKEHVIKQIDNPLARRIKYKDERKITVGLSKKDIMNSRGKNKNAFYNCFAIIVRLTGTATKNLFVSASFREIHIKVFNTGNIEIPGLLETAMLEKVKTYLLVLLRTHTHKDPGATEIAFVEKKDEHGVTVEKNILINSNFNCGFNIQRDQLHPLLSKKYGIETSFDPCSYPGIKCKFYYNNFADKTDPQPGWIDKEDRNLKLYELHDFKKYTEVSFMIFRTGSVLIVGNCSEHILYYVYRFICGVFAAEYKDIVATQGEVVAKIKKPKVRRAMILLD